MQAASRPSGRAVLLALGLWTLLGLGLAECISGADAQSILPNAQTQFLDSDGSPLAAGSVTFYVPGTTTLKATFSDSGLTTQNPNPVLLDGAGRAQIWGAGTYREIVQDVNGVQVWDQITSGFNNTFYASGTVSTGSAGAYALASPGAPGYVQGVAYSFRPNFSSVGGDTLNVNGLGPKPIYKNSGTGAVPIAPNDIVAGFDVIAVYDTALNSGAGGFASITTSGVSSLANATNGGLAFSAASGNVLASLAPSNLPVKTLPSVGDIAVIGDSAVSGVPGKQATLASVLALLPGWIGGLTLSNDPGTPNTVLDIAPGTATDSSNTVLIQLPTAFTKLTSGSWVAGSGNNGMAPGTSLAPGVWFYVFLINNSGSADVLFSRNTTAADAPAGTTAVRRIGSFLVDGGSNIVSFLQYGDYFEWGTATLDFSTSNPGTAPVSFAARTPTNFSTLAVIAVGGKFGSSAWGCTFFAGDISAPSPSFTAAPLMSINSVNNSATGSGGYNQMTLQTNSGGDLLHFTCNGSDSSTAVYISTIGYYDGRGRFRQ